jgi:hypothetical protein
MSASPLKTSVASTAAKPDTMAALRERRGRVKERPGAVARIAEGLAALQLFPPEKSERLRLMNCAECHVPFAASELMYLSRAAEQLPISCPAGHAHVYPRPDAKAGNFILERAALLAELSNLQQRVKRAEARAESITPAAGADGDSTEMELKRRARALANTARSGGGPRSGVLCPVCGKRSAHDRALYQHLLRHHKPELMRPLPLGN